MEEAGGRLPEPANSTHCWLSGMEGVPGAAPYHVGDMDSRFDVASTGGEGDVAAHASSRQGSRN